MTRRPGMSLTEVLVALFILTIGVIGILTMFPLGAIQMARAVRDDRSALAASNADAYMRWYWQTFVVNPTVNAGAPASGTQDTYLINTTGLFDNPGQLSGSSAVLTAQKPIQLQNQVGGLVGQVSYPVIIDPMGYVARPVNFGDSPTYAAIPRYNLSIGLNSLGVPSNYMYRMCSLTDSLGYNENGSSTGDLEMRYNWMWVLQRPQMTMDQPSSIATQPNNLFNPNPINLYNSNALSVVNMTVVVFDRRAFGFPGQNVQGFETVINGVSFTSGLSTITISNANSAAALDLKPGSWVMDATINSNMTPFPIRQANFYRVVSVTEVNGNVNVEVQTPISPPTGYQPLGYTYTGTLVALNGVSGVFVRPPLVPYPQ